MPDRISFQQAITNLKRGREASRWPTREVGGENRVEPICKPVINPTFALQPGESVFTMGSCFAREVEIRLQDRGFTVPCLGFEMPFEEGPRNFPSNCLTKFTAPSMLNEIKSTFGLSGALSDEACLVEVEPGRFLDTQLNVKTPVTFDQAMERRRLVRELVHDGVLASRVAVITLGMIETWFDIEAGAYVNSVPALPLARRHPHRFHFEQMSLESTLAHVDELVKVLGAVRGPDLRILLTVSPVPVTRTFTDQDIITANTYSKSVLRIVAEAITRKYAEVDYFPSYEMVMLSDRLLTWQDDMIHVNNDMVEVIVSHMLSATITRRRSLGLWQRLSRRLHNR